MFTKGILQCGFNNYSSKIKHYINSSDIDSAEVVEFESTESLLINNFSQTEMFLTDISKLESLNNENIVEDVETNDWLKLVKSLDNQ